MQSISRRGNCYDNAHAESFWSRLKTVLLAAGSFCKLSEARLEISHYIAYYNAERRHSALGYLAPNYIEALAEAPRIAGRPTLTARNAPPSRR